MSDLVAAADVLNAIRRDSTLAWEDNPADNQGMIQFPDGYALVTVDILPYGEDDISAMPV